MTEINYQQVADKVAHLMLGGVQPLPAIMSKIIIQGRDIGFTIDISGYSLAAGQSLEAEAIEQLSTIESHGKITIILTSNNHQVTAPAKLAGKIKHQIEAKKIILVAAGKGGVGKSTMAALIAQQLSINGYKTGLVDADIYGPSIPRIFGINRPPEIINGRMIPVTSLNIELASIGFLAPKSAVIPWRGPLVSRAIYQLMSLTQWSNLDYLIVDMPPGTGDIHLSILENYHLAGMIIITTPQKIAEIDVIKTIELAQKFNVPMLGLIENMSYFLVPGSNQPVQLFTGNSGKYLSQKYRIPFICAVPLLPELAVACDHGRPLTNLIKIPIGRFI